MTRQQILQYVKEKYGTVSERLWLKYPGYEVLRHSDNGKWYGVIMDIPESKIGLKGDKIIDILVLKGAPDDIVHICETEGFAPAYHMNKKHWFSVILDDVKDNGTIFGMLENSYNITG